MENIQDKQLDGLVGGRYWEWVTGWAGGQWSGREKGGSKVDWNWEGLESANEEMRSVWKNINK